MVAATTTPGHHHVRDLDEEEDDNHLQNGDTSRDLRMDSDDIVGKLWFKINWFSIPFDLLKSKRLFLSKNIIISLN